MRQLFLPIIAVGLFIIVLGNYNKKSPLSAPPPTSAPVTKEIIINDTIIDVEIANSASERRTGLSNRETLNENTGMLFLFEKENVFESFWMKDMEIAIDILWIDDGKIVQIDKNIPPPAPDAPDADLILYSSKKPFDYVLEVNAGYSDNHQIKIGDPVDLSKAL